MGVSLLHRAAPDHAWPRSGVVLRGAMHHHWMSRGRAASRKGELVEVFNDRGRFQAEVQVSDEVRQGVVVAPLGYWASSSPNGRSADVVNGSRYADPGRAPTFSDTLVEVRRVE